MSETTTEETIHCRDLEYLENVIIPRILRIESEELIPDYTEKYDDVTNGAISPPNPLAQNTIVVSCHDLEYLIKIYRCKCVLEAEKIILLSEHKDPTPKMYSNKKHPTKLDSRLDDLTITTTPTLEIPLDLRPEVLEETRRLRRAISADFPWHTELVLKRLGICPWWQISLKRKPIGNFLLHKKDDVLKLIGIQNP
ncbi:unnamed protein product [Orchesella dallaii]|uniref:Uncharacterized protein n=1 Tax=Orchesella dallaii TaxID=48710 RepID=A0ABP1PKZ1_9HEXA